MNWTDIVVALLAFLGGSATALIAVIAARPKTRAEARHAEAEATADIAAGYSALLSARTSEVADLQRSLAQEKRKTAIVSVLTQNVEALEAELRKANQQIAALRGNLTKIN